MKLRTAFVTALSAVVVMVAPVRAHHSTSKQYDEAQATTIQGVITKVEWMSPHVWISVDVKNSDGSISTWRLESSAPNALFRADIRREMFELSKQCNVQIWPARDGSKTASGRTLTFADGKTLDISDKFEFQLKAVRP
jgi:hypothetical protein